MSSANKKPERLNVIDTKKKYKEEYTQNLDTVKSMHFNFKSLSKGQGPIDLVQKTNQRLSQSRWTYRSRTEF